jgi:hypothetical protein
MALCLKHTVMTFYLPGNMLYQTMLINCEVLLVTNILDPLAIFRKWLSPHKFKHPPPCCKWIRTFRKYGIMLPFSGITLQQYILKISELLRDLWWMDKRHYSAPCYPCLKKIPLRNRVDTLKEINVQVGKNLPCDSRSATRIFKFQSCYGVGCPVGIWRQVCINKGTHFPATKGRFFNKKTVIYIYSYIYIYIRIYKLYHQCCASNNILNVYVCAIQKGMI